MSANLVRYFRDCYEEDNRRSVLWNVFGSTIAHRLFCSGNEEVLAGETHRLPVDPEEGMAARQTAQLYQKERELRYLSFFVVGHRASGDEPGGKRQAVCAPLLSCPACFVEDAPFLFVEADPADLRLSEQLLRDLQGSEEAPDRFEEIRALMADGAVSFDAAPRLARLLADQVPGLDTTPMESYPQLLDEKELRRLLRQSPTERASLRLVPASVVALVPRATSTRGVVTELDALADASSLSAPLQVLFGQAKQPPRVAHAEPGWVPTVLSHAQKQVLASAARHPVTVVVGPPGTGKSFTIAALAAEQVSRGKRVLIASKMNHAVDVVGDKIERQLGLQGCVVRGGRRDYLKELKTYLRQLLSGMHTADVPQVRAVRESERALLRLEQEVEALEEGLKRRVAKELRWGRELSATPSGPLAHLGSRWARWRTAKAPPLWQLVDQLEDRQAHRVAQAQRHLVQVNQRRLADTLHRHRRSLLTFDKALRARTSGRQETLFQEIDFDVLLDAFPIWLVNLADVSKVLPLREGLFDVVILDEATQCDVASCLPVLQRARHAVVVGDPNQLRHISFLSERQQRAFADKHGLGEDQAHLYDYRNRSILDLFDERMGTQARVLFLDEHFRSVPEIIGFSNTRFYGDRLRILTEKPGQHRLPGLMLRPSGGTRDARGINPEEVRALVEDVRALVEEEAASGAGPCHSIGILSPLRDQVDAIAQALMRALPPGASEKHRLMVGTAHTFQGEERDVMFLSMAVDAGAHPGTFRFLERPDVFNVAVTRARTAQYVYCSLDPAVLPAGSLLADYLRHVQRAQQGDWSIPLPGALMPAERDGFALEIAGALEQHDVKTRIGYSMAGLTLDLVAYQGTRSCGIDLVGYPGPYRDAFPLERYAMFSRAGLPLVALSYARWVVDRAGALQAILARLDQAPAANA